MKKEDKQTFACQGPNPGCPDSGQTIHSLNQTYMHYRAFNVDPPLPNFTKNHAAVVDEGMDRWPGITSSLCVHFQQFW